MPIILSLETSTDVCSVAIHKDSVLQTYLELHIIKSHSENLTLLIQQALLFSKINIGEVDAIAVSMGPGSYTGLRVGISTAKGLCMSLDKPLIAINTLKAMALEVLEYNKGSFYFCPMIDARRMEVYSAIFDEQINNIEVTSAEILDENSYEVFLKVGSVLFFGNGADKFKKISKNPNAKFVDNIYPKAKYIGSLALEEFNEEKFEDIHLFEPFYLKDFVMVKKSN